MNIRLMQSGDLEEVAAIDYRTFNTVFQKIGRPPMSAPRSQANLAACLAINPPGCFVAVTDKVAGQVFSRCWGKLGWIGTFGVDPECHGQGIGTQLIGKALAALQDAGCTTIGLETMPESAYNVGMYTRLGFNPVFPTITMLKTDPAPSGGAAPVLLSRLKAEDAFPKICSLCQAVQDGLDYSPEVRNMQAYGWGETLLLGWPDLWGIANIRKVSSRPVDDQPVCEVGSMAIAPAARPRFGEALALIEAYAGSLGAKQIVLHVNTADPSLIHEVGAIGYRVNRVNLRFVYRQGYVLPNGVELSRWAM